MKKVILFSKDTYDVKELKELSSKELYDLASESEMIDDEKCIFDVKEFIDAWNNGYIDKNSYLFILEVI